MTKETGVVDTKAGRNALCPCGSGKKYKKCCLLTIHSGNDNARFQATRSSATDNPRIVSWIQQVVQKQRKMADHQALNTFIYYSLKDDANLISSLIDHLLNNYAADGRTQRIPDDIEQLMHVIHDTLFELRVLVEREHPWAIDMLNRFQLETTERVFDTQVDIRIQQGLKKAIYDAGIRVQQKLQEKASSVDEYYARFTAGNNNAMEHFINNDEKDVDDVFELVEPFTIELSMMPAHRQLMTIISMLQFGSKLLSELAVIMVLHLNTDVRNKLFIFLSEILDFSTISPVSLRRMLGYRNWLPRQERPALDNLIRLIRGAMVDCASMPQPEVFKAYATIIDGSGSQGFKLVFSKHKMNRLNHLLVKQQLGVKDAWMTNNVSKKDIRESIDETVKAAILSRVSNAYFKRVISHFINTGVKHNRAPLPALLQTAELVGEYWKPEDISFTKEIRMMEAMAPNSLQPRIVSNALEEAGDWPVQQQFASSWLEDNASVDTLLLDMAPSAQWHNKLPALGMEILDKIIEPKRFIWSARFVLMAMMVKNSQIEDKSLWMAHMINARALQQGKPLVDMPLMVGIAIRTILSARERVESRRL
ncbi:MAG: hypothetical protein GY808_20300 [Gammaproteobacteria bacterium]|nr:hypothetical protein [Gammaproteobacteria bacterium]